MYNKMNSPFEFYELWEDEQQQLLRWCQSLKRIEAINQNEDSYTIKHDFERSEGGFYIHNGAMKGAMMRAGFEYQHSFGADNMKFNVSQKSINAIRESNAQLKRKTYS